MAITHLRSGNRLAPWWSLTPVDRPFDRLFGEPAARWMPAVDVEETGEALVLTADLPGFTEESVEIRLENSVLTLRGEIEAPTEKRRYHRRERRLRGFRRSFTLPRTVTADAITATFENGVLRVHIPKAPESKGRTIPVRRAS